MPPEREEKQNFGELDTSVDNKSNLELNKSLSFTDKNANTYEKDSSRGISATKIDDSREELIK